MTYRLPTKRDERVVRIEVDDASPCELPALGSSSIGPSRGRALCWSSTSRHGGVFSRVPAASPSGRSLAL